jgi:hypothetical protein
MKKYCAADTAFWSKHQKVAIPGWLREDQKEGLHQEGHFTLIKQPRSPVTKEKEAKRRIPCLGGGGAGFKMATQAILPPPQWRLLDWSLRVFRKI